MTSRLYLPAPVPYSGPNRCGTCVGAGITGVRYDMQLPAVNVGGAKDPDGATVLVVDEICDECQGCGRAGHNGCRWDEGAYPVAAGFDPMMSEDIDDWPGEHECVSCDGRRWFPVQGFNEERVTALRVPCGCAESLMVQVTE